MSAEFSGEIPSQDSTELLVGVVLAIQANYYLVQLESGMSQAPASPELLESSMPHPATLLCTRRSLLKKLGQRVMVGDRVQVEQPDWAGGRGAISQVFPRRSELDRPPVANADQILLVFALAKPTLDPHQLSRFLVKAESTGLDVVLCLSKSDLVSPEERQDWHQRLRQWGYAPVFASVRQKNGLSELATLLSGKTTIVSGPSGVGKSSLINYFIPQARLRVGAVSGKLQRGRHTTRHVELFELPAGGLLADTPGFNQPELDCSPRQLAEFFPEIRQRLERADCQFSDCLHRNEPNCAVRGDWERYDYYLDYLEEAIARQQALERLGDPETLVKRKSRRQGQSQYEPKLETKKYRRPSRRAQQQALQELSQDPDELSMEGE